MHKPFLKHARGIAIDNTSDQRKQASPRLHGTIEHQLASSYLQTSTKPGRHSSALRICMVVPTGCRNWIVRDWIINEKRAGNAGGAWRVANVPCRVVGERPPRARSTPLGGVAVRVVRRWRGRIASCGKFGASFKARTWWGPRQVHRASEPCSAPLPDLPAPPASRQSPAKVRTRQWTGLNGTPQT